MILFIVIFLTNNVNFTTSTGDATNLQKTRGLFEFLRNARVFERNAPCATCKRAGLVVAKKQGLAFVAVEREDGSRFGEAAPGRSRDRRKQQRR